MPPNQSHISLRQQPTYYYNSVGEPGPLAGLIIGIIIVLAVAILGGWGLHRQNKRRKEKEGKLERQRKWYNAELRREQSAVVRADGNGVGRPESTELPPPYDGLAVPLRSLDPRIVR